MSNATLSIGSGTKSSQTLTINGSGFIASSFKTAIKMLTGSFAEAASESVGIFESLGLSDTVEERAVCLLTRALERGLAAIIASYLDEEALGNHLAYAASFAGLDENIDITIDYTFFTKPTGNNVLGPLQLQSKKWLTAVNISAADATNISNRLPAVIGRSLHDEWRSNQSYYSPIESHFLSPFLYSANAESDWSNYRHYLISMQSDPVFDESFSLAQIYVEPRCYFTSRAKSENELRRFTTAQKSTDELVLVTAVLTDEIVNWINTPESELSIKVISGGPGAGKSSYVKLLCSKLAERGEYVLFVPLHQIDLESGISQAINDFFVQSGHFRSAPLDQTDLSKTFILVLDGLDEIQMQGRAAQESALSMVSDLLRWLDRMNARQPRVKCILTGRELSIQSTEGLFKADRQILHLLPYFVPTTERRKFSDEGKLLAHDQRNDWWKKYGALTGKGYKAVPTSLKSGEIGEVTSQPLLNYLVALSFRRGTRVSEETNINSVYRDLLEAVYARSWAKNDHPATRDIPIDTFVRLLEEVAISVWHGAGRTTTLAEVEEHCAQSRVAPLLKSLEEGSSKGLPSLLLAFYFRQKGRRSSGEKTFEFTHKTFAEYLTCLSIVRALDSISKQYRSHQQDADMGIDDETALHRWLLLCGQGTFDSYLYEFVRREVSLRGSETCRAWQLSLAALLSSALNFGWPVHMIPGIRFTEQVKRIRNAEEALLACLNACAKSTGVKSEVKWGSEATFGNMLGRLQGQRIGPVNVLAMSCLSYLNLNGQCMDLLDLYSADLKHSSFSGCELHFTVLMMADVSWADFFGARISNCNANMVDLNGTRLYWKDIFQFRLSMDQQLANDYRDRKLGVRESAKYIKLVDDFLNGGAVLLSKDGEPLERDAIVHLIETKGISRHLPD